MINSNKLLRDIQNILNAKRLKGQKTILTVDLIREHQGNYHNANTSVDKSWNALFGAFIKRNQNTLGIRELQKDVGTYDDNDNHTTCSEWEII